MIFFRIQPKGLGIKGHYSETSNTIDTGELSDGLHVFERASQIFATDGNIERYGNEILAIEAEESWDNGDVEGVNINPEEARVIKRFSIKTFKEMFSKVIDCTIEELEKYDLSDWDDDFETEIIKLKDKKIVMDESEVPEEDRCRLGWILEEN